MSEKKVILILGKRGSGKSFLADLMLARYKRYLIYDTIGEYTQGVIFEDINELGKFWGDRLDKDFRLIYQPLRPAEEFDAICNLVYECGDMLFLVEEIDTFSSPNSLSVAFANIVQRGRHRDITLIGISQRPYGINRVLSSQAKELYSFVMSEPRDLEYLSQYIGKELEDAIRNLKQHQYMKWSADGALSVGVGDTVQPIIKEPKIDVPTKN